MKLHNSCGQPILSELGTNTMQAHHDMNERRQRNCGILLRISKLSWYIPTQQLQMAQSTIVPGCRDYGLGLKVGIVSDSHLRGKEGDPCFQK